MNGACRGSLYLRSGRSCKVETCIQIHLKLSQSRNDPKTEIHHDMADQDTVPGFE